jgi:hypothetical protein
MTSKEPRVTTTPSSSGSSARRSSRIRHDGSDEWAKILQGVMMVGMAVSAAEPSGLWGTLKESLASGARAPRGEEGRRIEQRHRLATRSRGVARYEGARGYRSLQDLGAPHQPAGRRGVERGRLSGLRGRSRQRRREGDAGRTVERMARSRYTCGTSKKSCTPMIW